MLIKSVLFVPLGVDSTPIGQRKRVIDPLVGASLITGGVGVLGDILGIGSQKKANEANLQATRETNQMNYQIAREANQMSQEQFYQNLNWLKKQYYDVDSYARLRQNLSQGGYNPALAYGNTSPVGSVGQASPTAFHAAQMEAGHIEPISYDGLSEHVGSTISAFYENQLKNEQADNVHNDSLIKAADAKTRLYQNVADFVETLQRIDKLAADTDLSKQQRKYYKRLGKNLRDENKLFLKQFDDLGLRPKKENELLDEQKSQIHENTELIKAQKVAIDMGLNLTEAQIKAVYQSIKESISNIETSQGYLDLASKETAQKIISMINNDAAVFEQLGMSKELLGSEKFKNYASAIISGLAAGVGAYVGLRKPPSPLKPKPVRGFGSSVPWQSP